MFVDLVDSTKLSAQMDPEDLRTVISAFQQSVASAIEAQAGFIARYMGDGVLAYFGYPAAQEDAVDRSLIAALSLLEELKSSKVFTDGNLQCRIGIASGLVVVGDVIGSGGAREHSVVGETPNLASRLQAEAPPGEIYVSDATRSLASARFEFAALPERHLKGFQKKICLWKVIAARAFDNIDTSHSGTSSHRRVLLGRDNELNLMLDRWRDVRNGSGQTIYLCGDAGLGKSCLTEAFLNRVQAEQPTKVRFQCSKCQKLMAILRGAECRLSLIAAVLCDFLDIENVDNTVALPNDSKGKRELVFRVLVEQLFSLAEFGPVVFIVEDLHWIDPSSLDLIVRTIEYTNDHSVLIVITSRPTTRVDSGLLGEKTEIYLSRLGNPVSRAIIDSIAADVSLPEQLIQQIIERTDGVPLFIEELTKSILESDLVHEYETLTANEQRQQFSTIPLSLHDSLMARLDRIHSAKRIGQIASCIGREFRLEELYDISNVSKSQTDGAIEELVQAGLLVRRHGRSHEEYFQFKHAMVRDAAYESLLKTVRLEVHKKIAVQKESQYLSSADPQPQIVATHYSRAGNSQKACMFWTEAAEQAMKRYENAEALAYLASILETSLEQLPDHDAIELQIDCLKKSAGICLVTGDYAQAENFLQKGLKITARKDLSIHKIDFERRFGTLLYQKGDTTSAAIHIDNSIQLAKETDAQSMLAIALQNRGSVFFSSGSIDSAITCYMEALSICRENSNDAGVAIVYTLLSSAYNRKGDPSQALKYAENGIAIANEVNDVRTAAWMRTMSGESRALLGDLHEGMADLNTGYSDAETVGDLRAMAWNQLIQGLIYLRLNQVDKAYSCYEYAVRYGMESGGFRHEVSYGLNGLAESEILLANYDAAEAQCRKCLDIALPMNNKIEYGAAYTFLGRIFSARGDARAAEAYFEKAVLACEQSGSSTYLCRALILLAQHFSAQNDSNSAEEALCRAREAISVSSARLFKDDLILEAQASGFQMSEIA